MDLDETMTGDEVETGDPDRFLQKLADRQADPQVLAPGADRLDVPSVAVDVDVLDGQAVEDENISRLAVFLNELFRQPTLGKSRFRGADNSVKSHPCWW